MTIQHHIETARAERDAGDPHGSCHPAIFVSARAPLGEFLAALPQVYVISRAFDIQTMREVLLSATRRHLAARKLSDAFDGMTDFVRAKERGRAASPSIR